MSDQREPPSYKKVLDLLESFPQEDIEICFNSQRVEGFLCGAIRISHPEAEKDIFLICNNVDDVIVIIDEEISFDKDNIVKSVKKERLLIALEYAYISQAAINKEVGVSRFFYYWGIILLSRIINP